MRRARPRKKPPGRRETGRDRDAALLLLSVSFLLGAAAGILLERLLPGEGYGARFWQAAGEGFSAPPLWLEVWAACRWPAALLLLSVLPLRGGTVPTLFFLRGTLLSYCLLSLAGGGSLRELAGTAAALGPACLLTVPVLFLMGTECLLLAAGEERGRRRLWGKTALCLPLLALAVLTGQALVPALLTALFSG